VSDRREFLVWVLVLWFLGYLAAAIAAPPDPFTQLLVVGPLLVLALPVAWWLTYRGDLSWLD
jgi:Sec-independent protein secretion pathway component TatC